MKIAYSTTNMTGSPSNLHNMVPTRACIQDVLKVTSVMSRNVCYTVPSDVLSLRAFTLRSTVTLSFQYKCQTARCNVYIMEWATLSLTVWFSCSSVRASVCASRNIVSMISCRVFDTFSSNLHQWCINGQRWRLHNLGSKFTVTVE